MFSSFAFLDFGMPELLVILAIVLLLFGGKKLPEVSKALGESMRNLREGFSEANGAKEDLKKSLISTKETLTGPVKPIVTASSEDTEEKAV